MQWMGAHLENSSADSCWEDLHWMPHNLIHLKLAGSWVLTLEGERRNVDLWGHWGRVLDCWTCIVLKHFDGKKLSELQTKCQACFPDREKDRQTEPLPKPSLLTHTWNYYMYQLRYWGLNIWELELGFSSRLFSMFIVFCTLDIIQTALLTLNLVWRLLAITTACQPVAQCWLYFRHYLSKYLMGFHS